MVTIAKPITRAFQVGDKVNHLACEKTLIGTVERVESNGKLYSSWTNGVHTTNLPEHLILVEAASISRGGGLKHDGGKARPALLMEGVPLALAEVVETLTFGAQKYEAHSWKLVENALERYQDASYRHDMKRCTGELRDPETGIMHRAHHIINELFLLQLELENAQ